MKILLFLILLYGVSSTTDDRQAFKPLPTAEYIIFSITCVLLVLLGGLMSGLTVGLLGIDEIALELKIATGTPSEKKDALKVLKIVNQHHLLLVTLLLANAFAMEALPLFLDTMFNTEISVVISVTFVLAFGEIIPQSLCTGSNQIKIACRCVPIVRVFMIVLFPLSYPLAKLLDKILGHKETKKKLDNKELRTFIGIQQLEDATSNGLDGFQVTMMTNLIDLSKIKVKSAQIQLSDLPMIEKSDRISQELLRKLLIFDYNFITIYFEHRKNVCGTFYIKKVFSALKDKNFQVSTFTLDDFFTVNGDKSCLECLKMMNSSKNEVYFVTGENDEITGIVLKEGIIKKILNSEKINQKSNIHEISNALIGVLETRDKPNIISKTETITRTKRVASR